MPPGRLPGLLFLTMAAVSLLCFSVTVIADQTKPAASEESASETEAEEEIDELLYVSPPPPPLPDLRKLEVDRKAKQLLIESGLPARRQARLLRMVSGAYQSHDFKPFWAGQIPDIIIERVSDSLKSHALDPFAIPHFASEILVEGPLENAPSIVLDDIRLTLQIAETALLLKEGPATEELIWKSWNQGDTPGTIGTVAHTENVTRIFSERINRYTLEPERIVEPFVPQNWIYQRLRNAWLANVANPNPDPISFSGNAYRGKRYSQAGQLASMLEMQGFLTESASNAAASSGIYTTELSQAVRDFQRANGLRADGILGPKTLGKLKRDPNRDRQLIVLNMHRARLIPNEMGRRHVMVNLPSGEIFGFTDQKLGVRMRIVFGRNTEDRRTPIFRDTMEEVIFRPYWWVPKGIAVNEYLGKGASRLSRGGFEIVKGGFETAKPVRMNSSALRGVANGDLILRQRAGYGNALGLVKFRFPNDHAVYFHDTPQKSLFSHSQRAYSHGCMRLHKPTEMAEWVLNDDPDWSKSKIKRAMSYGNRNVATLKEPMNVFVVYFTVFPMPDRESGIAFLDDVYGRDMASLGALLVGTEE